MVAKSRHGCITCRIRRIKCDETHPSCNQCKKSKRKCDGYLPPEVSVPRRKLAEMVRQVASLAPASQTLMPMLRQHPQTPRSALDVTLFDMFRESTGPGTASFLPSRFWVHDALQMAHAEPALWHATLSLGALHRTWKDEQPSPGGTLSVYSDKQRYRALAETHYQRAISMATSMKSASALRALSIVLVAVSNFLGNWSDSSTHLLGGLRLLDSDTTPDELDSTAEILERLDLQSMTFSDSTSPYPYAATVRLKRLNKGLRKDEAIHSYAHAATVLFRLMRRLVCHTSLLTDDEEVLENYQVRQEELHRDLAIWEQKMEEFEGVVKNFDVPALAIRLYHCQLRLYLAASLFGPETRWDSHLPYFERLTLLSEELESKLVAKSPTPFSLEPAIVCPLFTVAQRCRHPVLRQRALTVLRRCKRQEGPWNSDGAAAVLEKVVDQEERTHHPEFPSLLSAYLAGEDFGPPAVEVVDLGGWGTEIGWTSEPVSWKGITPIPESRRVRDVYVRVNAEKKIVDLTFVLPDLKNPGGFICRDELAVF